MYIGSSSHKNKLKKKKTEIAILASHNNFCSFGLKINGKQNEELIFSNYEKKISIYFYHYINTLYTYIYMCMLM